LFSNPAIAFSPPAGQVAEQVEEQVLPRFVLDRPRLDLERLIRLLAKG
jgi:hypothetical protein